MSLISLAGLSQPLPALELATSVPSAPLPTNLSEVPIVPVTPVPVVVPVMPALAPIASTMPALAQLSTALPSLPALGPAMPALAPLTTLSGLMPAINSQASPAAITINVGPAAPVEVIDKDEPIKLCSAFTALLIQPYRDAIQSVDDVKALKEWIPTTFADKPEMLAAMVAQLESVEDATQVKQVVDTVLILALTAEAVKLGNPSPWDIARLASAEAKKAVGLTSAHIPVTVTYGPNVFHHQLTEAYACGLAVALHGKPGKLSICGQPFTSFSAESWLKRAESEPTHYRARFVQGKTVAFSETGADDFFTATKTAAEWSCTDHKRVLSIELVSNNTTKAVF